MSNINSAQLQIHTRGKYIFGNDFEAAKLQSIAVSFQRMIQQI